MNDARKEREQRTMKTVIRYTLKALVWGMIAALIMALVYGLTLLIGKDPVYFAQQTLDGLKLGFVFALIALGYTLVYGIVKLINFAHGDVFMVGAFTSFYAITRYGWGFVPAILLAMVVCTFLNVIIERVAYKPLRNAPRISALITAIGVSFFLEYFTALQFVFGPDYITYKRPLELIVWDIREFTNVWLILSAVFVAVLAGVAFIVKRRRAKSLVSVGEDEMEVSSSQATGGRTTIAVLIGAGLVIAAVSAAYLIDIAISSWLEARGVTWGFRRALVLLPEGGGIKLTNITVVIIAVTLFLLFALQYVVGSTKIGKAMRTAAYDKPTARLMGINVDSIISFTFGVAAAFAGGAGVLYAIAYPQVLTFMGIMPGLKAFVAAVLGGIGSIPGAFVGALLMGQLDMLTVAYVPYGSRLKDGIAFIILIIVFLVRPTGIMGEPEREKV